MNSSFLLSSIRTAPGLRRGRAQRGARKVLLLQLNESAICREEQSRGRWQRLVMASLVLHIWMALGVFVLGLPAVDQTIDHTKAGSTALDGESAEVELEVVETPVPERVAPVADVEAVPVLPPHPSPRPPTVALVQKAPVTAPVRPIETKPRQMAVKVTSSGVAPAISRLVVGAEGFQQPPYPREALMNHQAGTVVFKVTFDEAGNVAVVEVIQSSGALMLDSSARQFIRSNWKNASFAGLSVQVPIEFRLGLR